MNRVHIFDPNYIQNISNEVEMLGKYLLVRHNPRDILSYIRSVDEKLNTSFESRFLTTTWTEEYFTYLVLLIDDGFFANSAFISESEVDAVFKFADLTNNKLFSCEHGTYCKGVFNPELMTRLTAEKFYQLNKIIGCTIADKEPLFTGLNFISGGRTVARPIGWKLIGSFLLGFIGGVLFNRRFRV